MDDFKNKNEKQQIAGYQFISYITAALILIVLIVLWHIPCIEVGSSTSGIYVSEKNAFTFSFKDFWGLASDDLSEKCTAIFNIVNFAAALYLFLSAISGQFHKRKPVIVSFIANAVSLIILFFTLSLKNSLIADSKNISVSLNVAGWFFLILFIGSIAIGIYLNIIVSDQKNLRMKQGISEHHSINSENKSVQLIKGFFSNIFTEKRVAAINKFFSEIIQFLLKTPGDIFRVLGVIFVIVTMCIPFTFIKGYIIKDVGLFIMIAACIFAIVSLFINNRYIHTASFGIICIAGIFVMLTSGSENFFGNYGYGSWTLLTANIFMLCGFVMNLCTYFQKTKEIIKKHRNIMLSNITELCRYKGFKLYFAGLTGIFISLYLPYKREYQTYVKWKFVRDWILICPVQNLVGILIFAGVIGSIILIYLEKEFQILSVILNIFVALVFLVVTWKTIDPNGDNIEMCFGIIVMLISSAASTFGLWKIHNNRRA